MTGTHDESILSYHHHQQQQQQQRKSVIQVTMLESITIFNKGGLILYQYLSKPSVLGAGEGAANSAAFTESRINTFLQRVMLGRKQLSEPTQRHEALEAIQTAANSINVVTDYLSLGDKIVVALYPDIMFDGPRAYLKTWIQNLMKRALEEYNLYEQAIQDQDQDQPITTITTRPDPKPFDKTFRALLEQSKADKAILQQQQQQGNNKNSDPQQHQKQQQQQQQVANSNKKGVGAGGKEKRTWHDGKAKVTKEAMAQLDFSKADSHTTNAGGGGLTMDPSEAAIAEARAAYLPNYGNNNNDDDNDLEDDDIDLAKDNESSWGTSLQSVFQQMTGNKVLTASDLKGPLDEMQKLLTSKNVAQGVAKEICDEVQKQLVGKKLNSFYRVKTAVRQGLEKSITNILHRGRSNKDSQLDIIRAAMNKKNQGGGLGGIAAGLFGGSNNNNQQSNKNNSKPYVIVNVGINGVGKSTSLAKLAYYFQSHQLRPILVAGDTFRSGAVEQLNVHAKCLEVPMFQQGYAKDPSSVAKAAIAHVQNWEQHQQQQAEAAEGGQQRPDVVLIDTAGRMQNNAPLMTALGKLVRENQPDLILLVAEALVGNDGVDQLRMFNRAMQTARRQVDAVILTKFDTVSDKVGAALTMTHITGAPILFVGTGQKYHHLKPLQASAVIRSLFA